MSVQSIADIESLLKKDKEIKSKTSSSKPSLSIADIPNEGDHIHFRILPPKGGMKLWVYLEYLYFNLPNVPNNRKVLRSLATFGLEDPIQKVLEEYSKKMSVDDYTSSSIYHVNALIVKCNTKSDVVGKVVDLRLSQFDISTLIGLMKDGYPDFSDQVQGRTLMYTRQKGNGKTKGKMQRTPAPNSEAINDANFADYMLEASDFTTYFPMPTDDEIAIHNQVAKDLRSSLENLVMALQGSGAIPSGNAVNENPYANQNPVTENKQADPTPNVGSPVEQSASQGNGFPVLKPEAAEAIQHSTPNEPIADYVTSEPLPTLDDVTVDLPTTNQPETTTSSSDNPACFGNKSVLWGGVSDLNKVSAENLASPIVQKCLSCPVNFECQKSIEG